MLPGNTKRRVIIGGTILVLVLIGFGAGVLLAALAGNKPSVIPRNIAEKTLFPIYLPDPLPEGYSIPETSYHVEEGALLFQAVKTGGKKISLAEQIKPKDFDFNGFYTQQLTDTKNLQGAPYTSVLGKTKDGSRLLSIVTDKTWLLITSRNASEADLRSIAENLKQQ